MLNILIADQDPSILASLGSTLARAGHAPTPVTSWGQAVSHARGNGFDLAICDIETCGLDGLAVVRNLKLLAPAMQVILTTSRASVREAITAIRAAAADYLPKPLDLEGLLQRVGGIVGGAQGAAREGELGTPVPDALEERSGMVGQSPQMVQLRARIAAIADSDTAVLVTGESGTGKELVARAIHRESRRATAPLVTVNAATLPPALVEAELFGHERGAFTGAERRREGRFLAAHKGTLFLDEIGDLPLEAQTKLLRVLQEGTFEPLGSNKTVRVDVRLVSATNRNLQAMVAAGRFREDLLFRLRVFELEVPSLRERMTDIPMLVEHLLARLGRPGERQPPLTVAAWEALMRYPFPGNVRELENSLTHALVLARGQPEILPGHFPPEIQEHAAGPATPGPVEFRGLENSLSRAVERFERAYIQRALAMTGGEKKKAAQMLGISRQCLYQKIAQD
jgi:DNA-binding NtrC family response regulator